ncbi:MAG: cytidylate kinase-like family protein [Clostridiales bacterium]|nr:cytidylate kinase-like family protein [Clostridiales bacterium]
MRLFLTQISSQSALAHLFRGSLIITIGRQYGSGGREIGKRLAERLGYDYYDTVLLEKASQGSGLSEDVIARYDERLADKWMNASLGMSGATEHHKLPLPLRVAFGQFEEIRKIGKCGRAVIVGRCADQILKEQDNVFSAFIYADMALRIARVANRNHISEDEAKKRIRNTDKNRANYYSYYTDAEWGKTDHYHLCIDSGVFGIEGVVHILETAAQNR